MKLCFLLRATSGAGKSTLAAKLSPTHNAHICSADDFFITEGVYKFDASKLGFAHKVCQQKFSTQLEFGLNVIVDNTNIIPREFMWYLEEAYRRNYLVVVVEPIDMANAMKSGEDEDWAEIFVNRNAHGVPKAKILEKLKVWKPFDQWLPDDVDYKKVTSKATYYFSCPTVELP